VTICTLLKPDSRAGGNGSASTGSRFGDDLEHALRTTFDQFYGTRSQRRHETSQAAGKCVMK